MIFIFIRIIIGIYEYYDSKDKQESIYLNFKFIRTKQSSNTLTSVYNSVLVLLNKHIAYILLL